MNRSVISRLATSAGIAVLLGLLLCLVAFVLALFYAFARGTSLHVPGLLDYVSNSSMMSVQPASTIPVTFLILAVLCIPVGWKFATKASRRK